MTQWLGAPSGLGQGREILPEWGDTMLLQTSLNLCLPTLFDVCIYIYTYVCMHVCSSEPGWLRVPTASPSGDLSAAWERKMYVCLCMCIYNYLYTFIHIHAYQPTDLPTDLPTYPPTHLHTCLPTHLPTYIHTYIQTRTHTHSHIICMYLLI